MTVNTVTVTAGFLSPLIVQDLDGDAWLLTHPLIYRDAQRVVYVAPMGFTTDLASIPRFIFWRRKSGTYNEAAVLHDALYAGKCVIDPFRVITRADADRLFLDAMQTLGVGWWTRRVMYAAVRVGGGSAWNTYQETR